MNPAPTPNRPTCPRAIIATAAALLLAATLALTGCILEVTALILSPGAASIEIAEGDTVNFRGAAIGGTPLTTTDGTDSGTDAYGFYWDLDGNQLSEGSTADTDIEVTFPRPGTYTIALTAVDKQRNTDTASVQVFVRPLEEGDFDPLEAMIVSPTLPEIRVPAGQTVTFRGMGTGGIPFDVDEETGDGVEPYGYFWDTGGQIELDPNEDPSFREIAITFEEAGLSYPIDFTVRDSRGVVVSDAITVVVVEAATSGLVARIATPGSDITINEGDTVSFSATATGGTSPYTYGWNLPGSNRTTAVGQSVPTVSYASAGTYVASLTVTDSDGKTDRDTVTVRVVE